MKLKSKKTMKARVRES